MRHRTILLTTFILLLLWATPLWAQSKEQSNAYSIDYTVKVADIEQELFHVTTEIKNIKDEQLELSLPTWTPGWYTIENYAKNMLRFKITNSKGESLPYVRTHKQTWQVATLGVGTIKIEYDYRANILALNQAKIAKDYAFFTGTQLFLQVSNHRKEPATVHFEMPKDWRIISALKNTADPLTFTATDYDNLVDSPTEMGNFDLVPFEVEGKPHYFVANPAGTFSKEKAESFTKLLTAMIKAESAIFGGLPYEKYLTFYFFARPESNAGGALEHSNAFVAFAPSGEVADPNQLISTAAHEFFHLWNVKRIRPAEMWPYDYSRENESPLLWVSEGITSYYGPLSLYRAHIYDTQAFTQNFSNSISSAENNPAHSYISPAESSAATWLGYDTSAAFEISYYTLGMNLGCLLDLSIRQDTQGQVGLDEVMRTLYKDNYLKNQGFTTDDLIKIINRLTHKDYKAFFQDHVWGVQPLPYNKILGYAGYKLDEKNFKEPYLGIATSVTEEGNIQLTYVEPGAAAAKAGLKIGDILSNLDGIEFQRRNNGLYQHLREKIDQNVKVAIKRQNQPLELTLTVGYKEQRFYQLVALPDPTAEQLKIRNSWLNSEEQKSHGVAGISPQP